MKVKKFTYLRFSYWTLADELLFPLQLQKHDYLFTMGDILLKL